MTNKRPTDLLNLKELFCVFSLCMVKFTIQEQNMVITEASDDLWSNQRLVQPMTGFLDQDKLFTNKRTQVVLETGRLDRMIYLC